MALLVPDKMTLKTKTILLDGNDPESKRAEILSYFHQTFSLYESLFECLKNNDAFYQQPNTLRHPLIFYYGHTAVFFINKLNVAGLVTERVNPHFESLLAIGVDEMSWDDINKTRHFWPSPAEVKAYRDQTRDVVEHFIKTCDLSLPIAWDNPIWIVLMGIEHERIHLETSAVLIRELPLEYVKPHPVWGAICPEYGPAPENQLLPVDGQTITLGEDRESPRIYGWDNEYGQQTVTVKAFSAGKFLVSNQEFLDFVSNGGYGQRDCWTEEGWNWVCYSQATHPVYWLAETGDYKYRSMLAVTDMPWNWPVEVNYLEAKAFCNWKAAQTGKSLRLPTEAEWSVLRQQLADDQPDWDVAPGNINLEHFMSCCPVNHFAFAKGFYDVVGNVWQWTETPIDGFNGFQPHPVYEDFSTPTFDGRHNLFKGGSWISTGNLATGQARYAFRRHFFQNAGFRYVDGEALPANADTTSYEADLIVSQYIEFHYGQTYFNVPNFSQTCAAICLDVVKGHTTLRALDIGCAAGRTAFELARVFDHVDAMDFSARLIGMPTQLQQAGRYHYLIQDEGELVTYKDVIAENLNLTDEILGKVHFMQGDACNLKHDITGYDLVFAGNLIDRLHKPAAFLTMIHDRIAEGGFLILTSPYTWLEAFTQREYWLGGFKGANGENVTTLATLKQLLSPHFTLLKTQDVPFVIRETRRKFQHSLAELSVWQKH